MNPHAYCVTAKRLRWDLYSSQLCHQQLLCRSVDCHHLQAGIYQQYIDNTFPTQANIESAASYKEQLSFGQIIAVACENHRNTLDGQNAAFINVRAGGTDSYHGALNDSDQRRAQSCVAIHLRLLLPTHSTGVNVCFTATVDKSLVLNYTARCSGGSQKLGNTIERLLKLHQK